MTIPYTRREFISAFLRGAGTFTVAASLPFAASCAPHQRPGQGRYRFPQGLASGDPMPDSVVLWTRVEPRDGMVEDPIPVILQVSSSEDFGRLVAERPVVATSDSDHTVRVLVTELEPDTTYHYRFLAGEDQTPVVGRTRTAPEPEADRPVRVAFAACQAYEAGYFGSWRALVNEDADAPQEDRIDFVLHLGDFIYEALGYGGVRAVPPFPNGGQGEVGWAEGGYAVTLEDYRHLYRTYLSDPDLQAARARFPFVVTWDDHEFTDDAWQSMSTYTTPGIPAQARKVAANQAWFEYIPALLTGHPGSSGVPSRAKDFEEVQVVNTPFSGLIDGGGLDQEPNNLAAVGSMVIYRSFRWGRHMELAVTDTRSFRSEHCLPGEVGVELSGNARYIAPVPLVRLLDAGREANEGSPPPTIPLGSGPPLENPRRSAPPGTLLGPAQKEWLKALLAASDAGWKVIASSVPFLPLRLDLDRIDPSAAPAVFSIDTWDGYPSEREEVLRWVKDRRAGKLVSLAGDNHHHFAGLMAPDFEVESPEWMGAEFAVAGVSAPSVWSALLGYLPQDDPLRPLVVHDNTRFGGEESRVEALNLTFLEGTAAALELARTGELERALEARNPRQNPHLRYSDTGGYGIAVALFRRDRMEVEFRVTAPPMEDRAEEGEPALRRVRFVLRDWMGPGSEGTPQLEGPDFSGDPAFPFRPPR
jgi:alkaline phosphatase D